jgi:NAD(P)-dependent dehydrogenase (short-subunit alcohol dehydrogenase family)
MSACARSHVVVTGTSSGIGRATALGLAMAGDHVYAGVRRTADAPAPPPAGPGEITPLLLDVTQALLPLLRRARGRIVLIGSIGARFTPPFTGPVSASKSAIATMAEALRQELAPWDIQVVVIEPASIHTEAVDKAQRDAERLLREAGPDARSLYADSFRRFLGVGLARERNGSPPQVVAEAVARALTTTRPRARYLVGKDSRRMAALGALLPTPLLDALRRRIAHQPAPRAQTAPDGTRESRRGTTVLHDRF